jgi:hypothetical protein
MSQSMEDLSKAFILNEWPGRNPFSQCAWEKLAWPSKKRYAIFPVLHRSSTQAMQSLRVPLSPCLPLTTPPHLCSCEPA